MVDNTLKKIDKFQFSLKDQIGIGSFGKVFKGKNEQTQDIVAVKMMDKKKIQNDEYLMQGLFSEIQVMKKLKSPYVVDLIEVLETTNNYYIIQEFCDGGDFRHILKKRKYIPENEAVEVLKNLLTGFTELLEHGIIHRDLKPENILRAGDIYKLADFGFARTVDNFNKQMLESLVGTPLYMSPQILKHENYTTKSDIWSLALIYYEMLYGQTPWLARSQYELVQKIENQNVQFPETIQTISQDSKDFIMACLQKKEEDRISWDDIFNHKLFKGAFKKYTDKKGELENQAIFIINNLRQKIYQERLDLEILFEKYGLSKSSKMNVKQFNTMMQEIDKTLTRQQIEYIFNKFDNNEDLAIDFDEFKGWLEQNNVRMSMRGSNQQSTHNRIQTDHTTEELEVKARQSIMKLKQVIINSNINLQLLFTKFNRGQQDKLQINEFEQMIKRINNDMSQVEIQATFNKFDTDRDGYISFQEFTNTLDQYQGVNQLGASSSSYSTNDSYSNQKQQVNNMNPNQNNIQQMNQNNNYGFSQNNQYQQQQPYNNNNNQGNMYQQNNYQMYNPQQQQGYQQNQNQFNNRNNNF